MAFGDLYLRGHPQLDNLPTQPWGAETLVLDLPGGGYLFSGLALAQGAWVRGRYPSVRNVSSATAGPMITQVYRLPQHAFREIDTRGWEYSFEREYHADRLRLVGRDFIAEIRFSQGLQGRLWTSRTDSEQFPGIFENFFRALVGYRLAECGGVLLHSAAIVRDQRARVLFGRSGAGKSTSARLALAAGWEVLSDDINALLPGPSGWGAQAIPFTGDLGQADTRAQDSPITRLYWLQQAKTPRVQPLAGSLALARLLACAPILNEDPYRLDGLLDNLTALVAAVGAGTLDFARDPEFLSLLAEG